MTPDAFVLFATILLLFPMGYLLLAAPAFLLVRFTIPVVPRLLRAMFYGYFIMLTAASGLATAAYVFNGRLTAALGMGLIAAAALILRPWFLRRFDTELCARDAGDAGAVRRLRRLHWGGMLVNLVQLAAVLISIPSIL